MNSFIYQRRILHLNFDVIGEGNLEEQGWTFKTGWDDEVCMYVKRLRQKQEMVEILTFSLKLEKHCFKQDS